MEEGIQTRPAKGRSGATIVYSKKRVVKIGHQLIHQYRSCVSLYPITPMTFGHMVVSGDEEIDMYVMERLKEPEEFTEHGDWSANALHEMFKILSPVWSREPPLSVGFDRDWLSQLEAFCAPKGFILDKLIEPLRLDTILSGAQYCIHGDPTLANVLMRGDDIVICDPIMPRGKIPSDYAVDVGKMLQSAIGWENHLYDLHTPMEPCVRAALGIDTECRPSMGEIRRSWFWCMVHLIRILPYVRPFSEDWNWAHTRARVIYKDLIKDKVEDECYMPSI